MQQQKLQGFRDPSVPVLRKLAFDHGFGFIHLLLDTRKYYNDLGFPVGAPKDESNVIIVEHPNEHSMRAHLNNVN